MRKSTLIGARGSVHGWCRLLVLTATCALGGCLESSSPAQSSSAASTAAVIGSVAPSAAVPSTLPQQNRAPTITGTPIGAVSVSTRYSFAPSGSDADGDTLTFSIANKPSWASFNTVTGVLAGTPTLADIGMYENITIAVTAGGQSAALPAFSIAITQIALGVATLSWLPPTENTDGTPLTNLSGYRIYYGTSPAAITQSIALSNASLTTYILENLSPATWYFAITAIANGIESERSAVVSKTVI